VRFTTIVNRLLELAGQEAGGEFETLVKFHVNLIYSRLLDLGRSPHETREFSLVTVSGTSKYGLPSYVSKVLNIEDATNRRSIWGTTARRFDLAYPGTTASGPPERAYPLGVYGVEKQPAAAGVITVKSDSAADSGANYKVTLTGYDANGVLVNQAVTLTGITGADSTQSFTTLERPVKTPASSSVTFTGNIQILDASANTLCRIPTYWDSTDHQWVEFYPIPSSALTYTVRAEMRRPPLVNDADWPEINADFHDLLIWGVTQDLFPKVGLESVGDRHARTFSQRLDEFLASTGDGNLGMIQQRVFANVLNQVINGGYGGRLGRARILGVDLL
jgi:hypothetical protein